MKVRVRMYRAGLGDCFLLTFDPDGAAIHVMIDCGVLLGTGDAAEKIGACVDDIIAATDNHIHVVVATHEHWDHVSGFHQAWNKLKDVAIDQVWFAWTEAPDDATAMRLRRDRAQRRQQLAAAMSLWSRFVTSGGIDGDPSSAATRLAMTRELLAFSDPLGHPDAAMLGATSTSTALDRLREERRDRAEYLEPGTHHSLPGLPDVRIYVLGPPRDERLLRKGRPSRKTPETYGETTLTLAATFFEGVAAVQGNTRLRAAMAQPFDAVLLNPVPDPASTTDADAFFIERYLRGEDHRKIDGDWLAVTSDLAIALDNDTNNTSLVLAFELGDRGDVLLFPADAQVGNWLSWDDLEFDVESRSTRRIVTSEELLGRTILYKVGHHGSHNATLRAGGLEKMTSPDLVAMIPVDRRMARRQGWAMPFPPLYERLLDRCRGRVLFLDEDQPDAGRLRQMSRTQASAFLARVTTTPNYVQLLLG